MLLVDPAGECFSEVLGKGPGHVVASGGIGSLQDIQNLLPFEGEGIIGAIAGRALYEGKLDFKAACKAAKGE